MKAFKSVSDLTRAAAAAGATVEIGGRTINAAGRRLEVLPRRVEAPKPEPSPPPAPPPRDDLLDLVAMQARLQAGQTAQVVSALDAIVDRLGAVTAPQPQRVLRKVRPVGFNVTERGPNGEALSFEPVFDRDPDGRVVAGTGRPVRHDIVYSRSGLVESVVHVYAPTGA